MDKLNFYEIESDYINYLRRTDSKIPQPSKTINSKPFCGIVLNLGETNYYAPISSFIIPQQTNFLIKDGNKVISSIRFSFMIPVPQYALILKDFSKEESNYASLLEKEHRYCKENIEKIRKKALNVYNNRLNNKDMFIINCCDFKKLESQCLLYNK